MPGDAGALARSKGLRLVGLSQVYPFNSWSDAVAGEVRNLIAIAVAAGAETISLIPRNDGTEVGNGEPLTATSALLSVSSCTIKGRIVERSGFSPSGRAARIFARSRGGRSSVTRRDPSTGWLAHRNASGVFRGCAQYNLHPRGGRPADGPIFPARSRQRVAYCSGVDLFRRPVPTRWKTSNRVLVDENDRLRQTLRRFMLWFAAGYDGPGLVSVGLFAACPRAELTPDGRSADRSNSFPRNSRLRAPAPLERGKTARQGAIRQKFG